MKNMYIYDTWLTVQNENFTNTPDRIDTLLSEINLEIHKQIENVKIYKLTESQINDIEEVLEHIPDRGTCRLSLAVGHYPIDTIDTYNLTGTYMWYPKKIIITYNIIMPKSVFDGGDLSISWDGTWYRANFGWNSFKLRRQKFPDFLKALKGFILEVVLAGGGLKK